MLVDKAEAARRLGVSIDTVERRLKRGELQGQQEQRAKGWRWLIEVPGDGAPADAPSNNGVAPADAPALTIDAPAENGLVVVLQDQITSLHDQLRMMTQQVSSRDNQITELITVVRQQQAMLPAGRRSWWRRLVGG